MKIDWCLVKCSARAVWLFPHTVFFARITFRLMLFFSEFSESSNSFPLFLKFSGICLKILLRICHKTSLATKQISKSCKSTIKTLQNKNSHDKESGSHSKHVRVTRISQFLSQPFHSQDLISNSPYYLPYNFYDVSLENLVLDQLKVP